MDKFDKRAQQVNQHRHDLPEWRLEVCHACIRVAQALRDVERETREADAKIADRAYVEMILPTDTPGICRAIGAKIRAAKESDVHEKRQSQ